MTSEEGTPKPTPTAENGDTGNMPTTRRPSLAAVNRFKRLSVDIKGQAISDAGNGEEGKALESALKSLTEPKKTIQGTLKVLKRMSISKDTNADRVSPANNSDVSEQANKKLANAFKKLGKAQMGLSGIV